MFESAFETARVGRDLCLFVHIFAGALEEAGEHQEEVAALETLKRVQEDTGVNAGEHAEVHVVHEVLRDLQQVTRLAEQSGWRVGGEKTDFASTEQVLFGEQVLESFAQRPSGLEQENGLAGQRARSCSLLDVQILEEVHPLLNLLLRKCTHSLKHIDATRIGVGAFGRASDERENVLTREAARHKSFDRAFEFGRRD